MIIRPAHLDDKPHLAEFTKDTFDWGDYVLDRFESWVEDDHALLVATVDGIPIGMGRGILMSPREMWLHAARVHPEHRRTGVASSLNEALLDWGRERGAQVARLTIETWNTAARRQVVKTGYRETSRWVYGRRDVDSSSPNPLGNGGTRVPGPERLTPASSAEAEPAWIAWSSGSLGRASRGLFSNTWWWRLLTEDDLSEAARERRLWACPSGWVMGHVSGGSFVVDWMEATDEELARLIRAVVDKAVDLSVESVHVTVAASDPARLALDRYGFSRMPLVLYERPL